MSLGTLYDIEGKTRTIVPLALIKHFNLDISVAAMDAAAKEKFPLGRVPAFEGANGFKLTEAIAINIYCK